MVDDPKSRREQNVTPNVHLRQQREMRGWTQQELADKVGSTPVNISRWESGTTKPGPHFRQQLSKLFEKSVEELGIIPQGVAQVVGGTSISVASPQLPSAVPPWNVPHRRNSFFTGREEILLQLHHELSAHGLPVALAQPMAISGLGGVGKTQTAIEYAYRYSDSYDAVFWVRADTVDLLASDFLVIASMLNLPERSEKDQSMMITAVKRWLDTHERWLLILDNADNVEAVGEFIPLEGKGHVLLTTRASYTGTIAQRIELDKMGRDEGTLFLLRRSKRLKGATLLAEVAPSLLAQAEAIVTIVDCLPLALDQAGAYIEETGCSFSDYLKFYKSRRSRLLKSRGKDTSGHPEPVTMTWSLSFDKIKRANEAAAELLRLCAFLAPDAIPLIMIEEGAAQLGPILQPVAEDPIELNEALRELLKYSLVRRDPETDTLSVHRLVQEVLKDGMNDEASRLWAERAVRCVDMAFPVSLDVANWPACQRALPHASLCKDLIERNKFSFPEAAQLLHGVGAYLRDRGQFNEAKTYLEKALSLRQVVLGGRQLDTAHTLNKLGEIYYELSDLDKAQARCEEALSIYQELLGSEHVAIAATLDNLGLIHHTRGDYEKAGEFYTKAVAMYERLCGMDSKEVAVSLNNLGTLYYDRVLYKETGEIFERSLRILRQHLEPDHPDIAECLNNLAMVYIEQERYELAEEYLRRTLEIWEVTMGPEYHHTATTLGNIGYLYYLQERYEEAIELYQQGLDIFKKTIGSVHYAVASKLNNLGKIYTKLGDYAQAESKFHEAISIYHKTIGADHPYAATSYYGLVQIYYARGEPVRAEPLQRRVITIKEQTLGEDHDDLIPHLERYADILRQLGRHDEAQVYGQRVQRLKQDT